MGSYQASFCHKKVWTPGYTQPAQPGGWNLVWGENEVSGAYVADGFYPMGGVYGYFLRLSRLGIWEKVLANLVKIKRLKEGRNAHPSLLIIDAQSVKTSGNGEQRGLDGGKRSRNVSARSSWTRWATFTKCWFIEPILTILRGVRCSQISS